MKLFSQNSNLYDHDTSTLQTDRQTDGRTTCLGNTALRVASRGKKEHMISMYSAFKILTIVQYVLTDNKLTATFLAVLDLGTQISFIFVRCRFYVFCYLLVYATADEAVAYMFYRCFFCFFPSTKTMRQPFSGTAERIFTKLLPNDTGENVV